MYKRIIKAVSMDDYLIKITFEDCEQRIFDCKPYLDQKVFLPLKNKAYFTKLRISFGTIVWPNGIDFDPEFLYKESISVKS